jgi:GcrA cell cycle regulator
MKSSRWDNELVEELKKLYFKKELTTIEIGKKLGFTKNAIIGKIHRLGLCVEDGEKLSNMGKNSTIKLPKVAKVSKSVKDAKESDTNKNTMSEIYGIIVRKQPIKKPMGKYLLEDLEHNMCTWPFGGDESKPDITFCGDIKAKNSSYCQSHLDNAYLAPKKQVRKTNLETFTEDDIVEEDEDEDSE